MLIKKENNVISIEFDNYCNIVAPALVQYDTGQILELIDVNDGVEVQFCNKSSKETTNKVVENGQVGVPDFLLQEALPINAYVQVVKADSSTTVKTVAIPVMSKTKPSEYVAPEDEQTFREYVEGIMEETKAAAEEAKEAVENFELTDEQIADIATQVDLTNYYDKAQINTKLNKKINIYTGEGAPSSTMNDYEDFVTPSLYFDEKSMELYTLFAAGGSVVANFKHPDSRNIYSKTEVDTKISTAIDEALSGIVTAEGSEF